MVRSAFFQLKTKLPPELKQEFYRYLDLQNIDRINLLAWLAGIVLSLLLFVDLKRYQTGIFYEKEIYKYLLLIHMCGILYFLFVIIIYFKRAAINSGKINPKSLLYVMLLLLVVTTLPQDILTFNEQGHFVLYMAFILITNWAFAISHKLRLIFNSVTWLIITATIVYVGLDSQVDLMINLYEVTGFTVLAGVFGIYDFNLRASKFMDEKMLEKEKKRIEELEQFKSGLYTNLTHEFRTPLTVINGMTDILRKNTWSNEQESALESIERNSDQLLNMIDQMLELARIEAKTLKFNIVQKDLIQFGRLMVASCRPMATKKNIQMRFVSSLEKLYMDVDEEKLSSVLSNLLTNAIKYTPEDGLVSLMIENGFGEYVTIKVTDTGYGIGKEHMPYLFDRFYRAVSGPARKTTGTGIGLALTWELIEMMDGKIEVESELGTGSTFTITLPVKNETEIKEFKQGYYSNKEEQTDKRRNIQEILTNKPVLLIIEDQKEIQDYLAALLEEDYIIEIANDGVQGYEKAVGLIPDIIICDIMMPQKDGITLTYELKNEEKTSHIPIILLTAKAEFQDKMEGLESGADAYLTKPFKPKELFIRLEKLIELRKNLQKKYRQFVPIETEKLEGKESTFIQKINSIIEHCLNNQNFGVEELAKGVFMSRMQLHRKLKALSDLSASHYIRNYRLYKAKPLLKDLERSISEIAFDVGFNDPNYFSKCFHKEFGMTPREYRAL